MLVLITGSTGLLGTELCRRLGTRHSLVGWARRTPAAPGQKGSGVLMESVDVTDRQVVLEGISRHRPEVVIHSAAMSDVDACELDPSAAMRFNAEAVESVARACASVGSLLITVSTDYVFDGESTGAYREESPPNPISVYGRSKLEGELRALKTAPRCIVLRVSGLYGPARPNFVTGAVERFRAGRPVKVVTDQIYSPSYAVDLAEGLEKLLQKLEQDPKSGKTGGQMLGILHCANSGGSSRLEVAKGIARHLGAPESLIDRTTWSALSRPALRPANSQLDCTRFSELIGGPLRDWKAALQAFLESGILDTKLFS